MTISKINNSHKFISLYSGLELQLFKLKPNIKEVCTYQIRNHIKYILTSHIKLKVNVDFIFLCLFKNS